jgi:hypothetical protein
MQEEILLSKSLLMGFYSLTKEERTKAVAKIHHDLESNLRNNKSTKILEYFSDQDTYIRKAAYQAIGKIFYHQEALQPKITTLLHNLLLHDSDSVRQTTINASGEIGMTNFKIVETFFDKGLFDQHHSVRNAVIGSIKKMGEKNPVPILQWAKKYLHHPDKEIRREICHGIELRGRTHPQDILPVLRELQFDSTARVRNTLVHVLGQISYKKGCLETVIADLKNWENKNLVTKAIEEIIDVHERYKDFAVVTSDQAKKYIDDNLGE